MCGIIGYVGQREASPILLEGLKKLEYRGYDSAGMAVKDGSKLSILKDAGKVDEIHSKHNFLKLRGKAGMAHCLHPDTLLQLADGSIRKISQLEGEIEVISLEPDTMKFNKKKAVAFKHESPRKLIEIRTPFNSIKCTKEHRMLIFSGGQLQVKTANELKISDILMVGKKINIFGESKNLKDVSAKRYFKSNKEISKKIRNKIKERDLSCTETAKLSNISTVALEHILAADRNWHEDYINKLEKTLGIELVKNLKPVHSRHGNFVNLPKTTSKELMRFIGYFMGDGTNKGRCVRLKDSNQEVLKYYQKLSQNLFNLPSRLVKIEEANAWMLEINSLPLCKWLSLNFRDSEKLIELIGQLPDGEVAAFTRGLFDAEGCVNTNSRQVMLGMTNEIIVRGLQLLLLRFGIVSSFSISVKSNPNWNDSYTITLSNKNALEIFKEKIGFASYEKSSKLNHILSLMRQNYEFSTKALPIEKPLMPLKLKRAFNIRGSGYATRLVLERALANTELTPEITAIQLLLNADVAYQKIISIREVDSDTEFVYDLEVDDVENFIANGLVSHNSRWATHGGVTKENAHPHISNNGKIAVVHNGIVENYQEIRETLQKEGFKFYSETDTEVIPNLIELEMKRGKNYIAAAKSALQYLEGNYAIVAINKDDNQIIAAKNGSPLVIGIGDGEYFAASDIPAFLKHTSNVVYLYDNDFVILPELKIYNLKQKSEVSRPIDTIAWNSEQAEKGEFDHFLLKEIVEQADTVQRAIDQNEELILNLAKEVKDSHGIFFVGCGTAYHACLSGSYIFSKIAREHINVVLASEFPNFEHFLTEKTLVIAVSQSGETADVLEAVKAAKRKGAKVISIVNVRGSSLHRESDMALLTNAGPEICVLSTKAYTSQLAVLTLLAYAISGRLEEGKAQLKNLYNLVYNLTSVSSREHIKKVAEMLKDKEHIFTIGRGILYPTALEAALKIKEVSYIHTEGFAGGELKHGTIALIERGTPCMVFASEENEKETVSNAMEIKSRGGIIIGIAPKNNPVFDIFIKVPEAGVCNPICHVVPAQILAYQLALLRGCDPDRPRNLAKSCTVK